MGLCCRVSLILIPVAIAYLYMYTAKTDPIPIVEDEFWGPKSEQGKKEDTSIRLFKIDISASVLEDLKARLKRKLDTDRFTPPLEGVGFEYGFNSKYMKTVGQHWLQKYDWKAREKTLNKYPQYKTSIGGLDIHFQHVKPAKKEGVTTRPLLLLHGWPGSFVEFQKVIPMLGEPTNSKYNYELVIPSLPGYGFSTGSSRPGLGTVEMANIFKRLMKRLGHEKFLILGGDWGAQIVSDMSTLYPNSILGAHSNGCLDNTGIGHFKLMLASMFPTWLTPPDVAKHMRPYSEVLTYMMREMGYAHIQATKPDTVGMALTQSPIGLAAYILEKFSTWTNREYVSREDGGFLKKFTLDELLDNIMVYWVTGSITTSQRLYSEAIKPSRKHIVDYVPTNVPFNCQNLLEDILLFPEFACNSKLTNIKRFSVSPKGGHFGAFEEPDVVADDALSFFNSL